ncbi:HvfC/BufC N-terminal domain-containing protein [Celeribacter litoreus]|uniref:HvfC/BufC N-terminal domain-containing protein n=1 Tax=Celeribacter litoreus TaxID=2876714 RepID=UPI001CCCFBBE|nr:DNA-binding domain-containing protein [Celeribacter litoreus]MCA0045157.1 putative DNA-binding domain-containing protein [Celeribacter litoreus]
MTQATFIKAALDPTAPLPAGLVTPEGAPATKRFAVYRNNIVVGLKDALAQGFPAVKSLVGDEFFSALSDAFLRSHPPSAPRLPLYGAGFAEFIAGFAPAQPVPYLPDVARLEYALRESYHAADSAPVDAGDLSDPLLFTRAVKLAPSVRWMSSDFPITSIHAFALGGPKPEGGAEDILITRRAFDPVATSFPRGTINVLEKLAAGDALEHAIEAAPKQLDLSLFLRALLDGAAITAIQEV